MVEIARLARPKDHLGEFFSFCLCHFDYPFLDLTSSQQVVLGFAVSSAVQGEPSPLAR